MRWLSSKIQLIEDTIYRFFWLIGWSFRYAWRVGVWWFRRGLGLAVLLAIIVFLGFFVWRANSRLSAIERTLGGKGTVGCDASTTAAKVQNSLALVVGAYSEGTAFAIGTDRLITNHHVVEYEPSPKIIFSDGTFEIGKVISSEKTTDLAIIQIKRRLTPLVWAEKEDIRIGQELLLFGYPYGGEINGPASVNRGAIAGFRPDPENPGMNYLQTNGGLIEGMSGGSMTTLCGQVAAVNTAGSSNMGLGISAENAYVWSRINWNASSNENPQYPEGKEEVNPDNDPSDAIWVYYQYISTRNYPAAYAMLSAHFIGTVSLDDWEKGFATQLQTAVTDIKNDPKNKARVLLDITSKDLVDGQIVYRYFSGSWLVHKINGHNQLWESNIQEIEGE